QAIGNVAFARITVLPIAGAPAPAAAAEANGEATLAGQPSFENQLPIPQIISNGASSHTLNSQAASPPVSAANQPAEGEVSPASWRDKAPPAPLVQHSSAAASQAPNHSTNGGMIKVQQAPKIASHHAPSKSLKASRTGPS